jgi:hypothetical protein
MLSAHTHSFFLSFAWCWTLVGCMATNGKPIVGEKFAILPLSILAACYYAIPCL